jgi:hypothetical protein
MSDITTSTAVLTAMITPAVLISAAGTLVLSTSNRLSRVVDRIRVLVAEAKATQTPAGRTSAFTHLRDAERQLITDQLVRLSARVRLLLTAMTVLYTAIGLFVATSIAIGVVALFQWQYGWIPVVSGLAGAGALLYSSVLLVREARLAVSSNLQELAFVRDAVLASSESIITTKERS